MPAIETIFARASAHGVGDIVVGMPHRGRLNFLVTLLDLPARYIFMKVRGRSHLPEDMKGTDDVISHVARSITKKFEGSSDLLHISLIHNP
eukprot:413767_1